MTHASRKVPVLVVSGFLGSGKTTLVRALLAEAQARGERMAVVSNEFGELGIDEALMKGGGDARFVELAGGCVCCELSDELVDTLEALRREVDPDRIVIETSGVALPYETQLQLYRPPVSDWVGDEAAVVVVDAERLLADEDTGATFEDQVTNADLLVLHKVDLVSADTLPSLHAKLTALNPDAPVFEAVQGNLAPELLFPSGPRRESGGGGGPAPLRNASPGVRPVGSTVDGCDSTHDSDVSLEHDHDHDHRAHGTSHHREQFASHELHVPDNLDPDAALEWIGARRGLRTKGFVRTTEGVRIVQGVGRRLELTEPGDLVVAEDLVGRVVVIVRAG